MAKKSYFKKIVWATDFSKESLNALSYALHFKKIFGSKIIAIHVIPEIPPHLYGELFLDESFYNTAVLRMKDSSAKKIAQIEKRRGIKFDKIYIEEGKASDKIIEIAEKENAELIFVGRKKRSFLEQIFVGSVSNRLMHHSRIPLLIVPSRKKEISFKKVLVPVDLEPIMEEEIKYAEIIAKAEDSEITVFHVMELFEYEFPMEKINELLENLTKTIEKKVRRIKDKSKVEIVKSIEASEAIVEYIKKHKIDLLIIATHSREGIRKFFVGSVTEKVVSRVNVPVLMIPGVKE